MPTGKIKRLLDGIEKRIDDPVIACDWAIRQVFQDIFVRQFPMATFDYQSKNILNQEWDVLLLLDGCRVDSLAYVADEYDFLPTKEKILKSKLVSIAGSSNKWMERTFTSNNDSESINYICGNPHSDIYLDRSMFSSLDEVWKYEWDTERETIPPESLTDHTISMGRHQGTNQRILVHYMQPHFPSLPHPELKSGIDLDDAGETWDGNIWDRLLEGQVQKCAVWEAYIDNLRYVLNDIERLLDNLDADTVIISADHGNAFGEHGFYGHGEYRVKTVREVPWISVEATDNKTYFPDFEEQETVDVETDVESRLRSLGYK